MEVFFCGKVDRLVVGRGVTILILARSYFDSEDTADAEFDARALCFDGVELMAVVSAATRTDTAAAALSSRRNTFQACFAAFRFLMTVLEKGDIVSGRRRSSIELHPRQHGPHVLETGPYAALGHRKMGSEIGQYEICAGVLH